MVNVAVPLASVPDPSAVDDPLSKKLTVPVAVEGVTVAVKVTLPPWAMLLEEGETAVVVAGREVAHAFTNALMSTEPSPVTSL